MLAAKPWDVTKVQGSPIEINSLEISGSNQCQSSEQGSSDLVVER
jgi:hypothetical protein